MVRVDNLQQLETAYKRVTRELAKAHIVAGALQQGEEDEIDAAGNATETTAAHVTSQSCTDITPLHRESSTFLIPDLIGGNIKQRPQLDISAVRCFCRSCRHLLPQLHGVICSLPCVGS